ncbi:MAG: ROK family protein, partial [Chloroflexi bacterium]|nr:ROK family protein [Chloroflexota bacterium]
MDILGIDIGGTGIKAAIVDTDQGTLRTERLRVLTPHPSTPSAVSKAVARVVQQFDWKGPIGCTFPAIVSSGVIRSAANVDKGWIGLNGQDLLSKATGRPVVLLNDADAAGIAELRFGAGRGQPGLV